MSGTPGLRPEAYSAQILISITCMVQSVGNVSDFGLIRVRGIANTRCNGYTNKPPLIQKHPLACCGGHYNVSCHKRQLWSVWSYQLAIYGVLFWRSLMGLLCRYHVTKSVQFMLILDVSKCNSPTPYLQTSGLNRNDRVPVMTTPEWGQVTLTRQCDLSPFWGVLLLQYL